jgi:hypothetical protein
MLMFHNTKVMGQFARGSRWLTILGWLATAAMAAACVGSFLTWKS